jgi:hypothetical protein
MERIFDSPRRVRFVAANVAASDTVKGSHIQRNPLSMGALAEPEEWPRVSQSPKEKKRRDCVMTARLTLSGMQQRKLAHSCEVGSYTGARPHARTKLKSLARRARPPAEPEIGITNETNILLL